MHMMSVRIEFGVMDHRRDRRERSFSRSTRVVCLQSSLALDQRRRLESCILVHLVDREGNQADLLVACVHGSPFRILICVLEKVVEVVLADAVVVLLAEAKGVEIVVG